MCVSSRAGTARAALVLVAIASGCGGGDAADEGAAATCVPSEAQWAAHVGALVAERCGTCHTDPPQFGAPYSLLDFAANLDGDPGARPVDRMVERLAAGTMPPPGWPRLSHADYDTLVLWASCGERHPDDAAGLTSSRPVFVAPEAPPDDLPSFELRAPHFPVGPEVLDLYQCFALEAPVTSDRFIRRIEPVVDEARVLHHAVLLRDTEGTTEGSTFGCRSMPQGSDYLYAWAPGAGAIEFPAGGFRVRPGEKFVLQIHYNNGAGVPDATDASGVRLYHAAPGGPEYGMFAPGPVAFTVPPQTRLSVVGECELAEGAEILAGMPHMHEIGQSLEQIIEHADGSTTPVIRVDGFSFELQPFYRMPVTLRPGDVLRTTCVFDNPHDRWVDAGERTDDEMCFNFMYVTPPPAARYCDGRPSAEGGDFDFEPGDCAPVDDPPPLPLVRAPIEVGRAPVMAPTEIADGLWEMIAAEFYLADPQTPLGPLDAAASFALAKGQLETRGARFAVDVAARLRLSLADGVEVPFSEHFGLAGEAVPHGDDGAYTLAEDCGENIFDVIQVEIDGDRLTFGAEITLLTLAIEGRIHFRRAASSAP